MEKRIAFLLNQYKDSEFSSGGIKLDYMLIKGLQEKGYKIDIYVNKIINTSYQNIDKIFHLDDIQTNRELYDLILSSKAIEVSDITYMHDHSYPFRLKMMHGKLFNFLYKFLNYKKSKKRLIEYLKTKKNLAATNMIVVSSQILKQDMIDNYNVDASKIIVLAPPISMYKVQKKENQIFTFGICAVGFERKGGYKLLKSIKILKKSKKTFKVKIIYPSKNLYVKLLIWIYGINKFCEFLPLQKDMSNFYNSIDCLLMPSLLEPFGMVATEALSVGCPVITGTNCGASDIVINNYNGFVYEYNTKYENNLAKKMADMINLSTNEMNILRKNSILSVQNQHYDMFVENYEKLINKILHKKNNKIFNS